MAKKIFISYSRKDFDKVKAIKDEIDRELGIKCWMDLDGIESGEQFENKIISAIKDHDTMLFMLSANSMNSIYALKELKFAQLKKKRVILVYIESCQMSDEFLFNYSMYDTVEWANSLQHDKLLKNLRQWFGSTQQTEPIDAGSTDPKQQFSLADSYYFGFYDPSMRNFDPNENEAIKWYHKAAIQGHMNAQYSLGEWYAGKSKWEEAISWFLKAAEQGDSWSQYQLGYYYDRILEIQGKPNYKEAIKWYNKSAEQGNEYAQVALAHLYMEGKGLPKDPMEGVKCYVRLAKQGYKPATEWLNKHNMKPYN